MRGWAATSPSRFFRISSPPMPIASRAFSARRRCWRRSTIRTSRRSTTSKKSARSATRCRDGHSILPTMRGRSGRRTARASRMRRGGAGRPRSTCIGSAPRHRRRRAPATRLWRASPCRCTRRASPAGRGHPSRDLELHPDGKRFVGAGSESETAQRLDKVVFVFISSTSSGGLHQLNSGGVYESVVGATGTLGSEICRLLAAGNKPVRALVRQSLVSREDRCAESARRQIVFGDLKTPRRWTRRVVGARFRDFDRVLDASPDRTAIPSRGAIIGPAEPRRRGRDAGLNASCSCRFHISAWTFRCSPRSATPRSGSVRAA